MLLEILILCSVIWYLVFHIRRKRLYKLAAEFDGPATLPIIGNALKCLMPLSEMTDALLKGSTYYKSPIRFWFGPFLNIYVTNPNDIKTVLNSPHALHRVPYFDKLVESLTGRGLLTSPVEEWKRHRRITSSIFNQHNLETFFSIMCRGSKKLVNSVKSDEGKEVFDAEEHVVKCILDILLESLLGYKSEDDNSGTTQAIIQLTRRILVAMVGRVTNILYFSEFIFKMSSAGRKFIKDEKEYNSILDSIIQNWKNTVITKYDNKYLSDTASSKPTNFVEHMLLTENQTGKLTAEELHGEVKTFIAAGIETTSSALGFLLIMLGMHPEIQEKVYQEITHVLGTRKQLQYDDLNNLIYLERTIKECLRIFPSGAALARLCDREIELEHHTIPAGSNIVIGMINVHKDPNIWPNPNKFDPDRFLPEEEAKRHPYSWIPFSAGPRNCIGFRFGMMALKIMSVDMVMNYKIKTVYKKIEDIRMTMLLVLRPTDGYKISVTAR